MMDENEFVSMLRTLPLHKGAQGLQDDCAILEIGGETLVINHDVMVENTHYRPDADMADVAWKLVAANLSDLASCGAEPVGLMLGFSLGRNEARFLEGLREILQAYDVPLMGGDTTATTGASTFSATAIGRATHTPVPSRMGAQIGDELYITGTVGKAWLGFEGYTNYLDAFNRPVPLLEEGRKLAPQVTSMMDVSDGLLLDAFRLAKASQVTIAIDSKSVPVADPARRDRCLRWGDDYQLLFTLPQGVKSPVDAFKIGQVEANGFAPLVLDGDPIVNSEGLGYTHS